MELNKETLFLLAKKLSNKNFFKPLINTSKMNNLKSNSFILNTNDKNINRKIFKFKNKFLEKNNIQINEEKMRNLLLEKKRKIKLALSQKNKNVNNKIRNIPQNSKIIKLDIDKERNKINSVDEKINRYLKILKNNKRNNYSNNTYYHSFNGIQFSSNNSESNLNIAFPKKIHNSNSDYFESNNENHIFISNKNSLKKNKTNFNLNSNQNLKTNYSRNKELINKRPIFKLNSIIKKNDDDYYITDINKDFDNKNDEDNQNRQNKINTINNNININININKGNKRNDKLKNRKSSKISPKNRLKKLSLYNNFFLSYQYKDS